MALQRAQQPALAGGVFCSGAPSGCTASESRTTCCGLGGYIASLCFVNKTMPVLSLAMGLTVGSSQTTPQLHPPTGSPARPRHHNRDQNFY